MTRSCDLPHCDRVHYGKGFCQAHYKRSRSGAPMDAPIRPHGCDSERFWAKVQKTDSCWKWDTPHPTLGYGFIRHGGRSRLAHRVSYEMHNGAIPDGMEIDHICGVRECVNPEHLRPVTSGQNKQNRVGATRVSKSGVRGVTWYECRQKWMAKSTKGGVQYYHGYFSELADAIPAVTKWRRENMPYSEMDKAE